MRNLCDPTHGCAMSSSKDLRTVFARRLRQARDAVGISQVELGRRAGMEPSVASPRINQYEAGQHLPQSPTLKRLATALEVPVTFLLAEDEGLAELILLWDSLHEEARQELLGAFRKKKI